MKLTLFGIWRHLLHEGNEVEEELCVVVGQFQIIAVLPEEHRKSLKMEIMQSRNIYTLSYLRPYSDTQHIVDVQKCRTASPDMMACGMHDIKPIC